jgi:hypothetical protein
MTPSHRADIKFGWFRVATKVRPWSENLVALRNAVCKKNPKICLSVSAVYGFRTGQTARGGAYGFAGVRWRLLRGRQGADGLASKSGVARGRRFKAG